MQRNAGFSLLEIVVVITAGIILITAAIGIYGKFTQTYTRQQRYIQVEREMSYCLLKMRQSMPSLPGRNLASFDGVQFSLPTLPANGSIINNSNVLAINSGIVTPHRLNNHDAVTIISGRANAPRLELVENFAPTSTAGSLTVAVAGLNDGGDSQSVINAANQFLPGDAMLLSGYQLGTIGQSSSNARVVRLLAPPQLIEAGSPARLLLQFTIDLCSSGPCSQQYPQLVNNNNATSFVAGSVLSPINLVTFYLGQSSGRSYITRNVGGTINGNGNQFQMMGGQDSSIGEADSLKISYKLSDGSIKTTPSNPLVPWINQVVAIVVEVDRTIPSTFRGEVLTRKLSATFPLRLKGLE